MTRITPRGRARTIALAAIGAIALVACDPVVVDSAGRATPNVGNSALPSALPRYAEIEQSLECIRSSGRLRNVTFSVGTFADSTGKINTGVPGATGNFLLQGGSASFITDALRRAGARVVSTYFGPPRTQIRVDYAINGIFNSLDFGRAATVDLRAGGVGPVVATGWAQLSLTIQLDNAATRLNEQMSIIQRPVRYQQLGFGIGRQIGDTLVTGAASVERQERLQLEALNGPIALGVIDVVSREFPELRKTCTGSVADLLGAAG
jgi:hypothetical protein